MEVRRRRGPISNRGNDGSHRASNFQVSAMGPLASSFGSGSSPIVYQQSSNNIGGNTNEVQPFTSPNTRKDIFRPSSEGIASASRIVGRGPPKTSVLDEYQSPGMDLLGGKKINPTPSQPDMDRNISAGHPNQIRKSAIYSQKPVHESSASRIILEPTIHSRNSNSSDSSYNHSVFGQPIISQVKGQAMGQNSGIINVSIHSSANTSVSTSANTIENSDMIGSSIGPTSVDPYILQTILFTWIVISGFENNLNNINQLIHRFQRHGQIVDYEIGKGNWMFIRFATAMQADQAIIHENNQLFQQETLLSVLPLSKDLVTKLQFQSIDMLIASNRSKLDIDTTTEQSQRSHVGEIGAAYRSHLAPSAMPTGSGFEQYLQPPKTKTTNICKKLMEFFFSY